MEDFSQRWLKNLISGVVMSSLSVVIFGGLIYTFITNPGSWIYIGILSICGFSTFVSSILMLYDSVRFKLKKDLKDENHKDEHEIKQHIQLLSDECQRIKPESISSSKK